MLTQLQTMLVLVILMMTCSQVRVYNKVQCLKTNRFKDEKHGYLPYKIYRYQLKLGQFLW